MRVLIEDIQVPDDRLRAPRLIDDLAQSMREIGQLQPIVLDQHKTLVCGWHRLLAGKFLGWSEIEAEVREFPTPAHRRLAEIDENLARPDLTALERIEHTAERVKVLEELGLKRAQGRPRKNPPEHSGFSTAEIGGSLGLGASTIRRNVNIWNSLPAPVKKSLRDSRFEDNMTELTRVARMTSEEQYMLCVSLEHEKAGAKPQTGGVRELQRDMQRVQTKRLGFEAPAPYGHYRTVVIDPPWAPEISGDVDPMGKIAPAYETWDLDRIRRLDVADVCWEGDCHLYLWVTNSTLAAGLNILEEWGFEFQQKIVWVKDRIGTGRYFRHQHEDCLFATKGSRLLAENNVPDVLHAHRGRHSAKPEEFYALVERCSPGPRLEMFARQQREGWTSWGAEVPREARERLPGRDDIFREGVG